MTRIMLTSEDQGYNHSVMRRKRMSDCRYDFLYALKTPTDCVFFVRMAEGVVLLGQAGNWNIWMSCSIGFVSREKFGFLISAYKFPTIFCFQNWFFFAPERHVGLASRRRLNLTLRWQSSLRTSLRPSKIRGNLGDVWHNVCLAWVIFACHLLRCHPWFFQDLNYCFKTLTLSYHWFLRKMTSDFFAG